MHKRERRFKSASLYQAKEWWFADRVDESQIRISLLVHWGLRLIRLAHIPFRLSRKLHLDWVARGGVMVGGQTLSHGIFSCRRLRCWGCTVDGGRWREVGWRVPSLRSAGCAYPTAV